MELVCFFLHHSLSIYDSAGQMFRLMDSSNVVITPDSKLCGHVRKKLIADTQTHANFEKLTGFCTSTPLYISDSV
jgi:hypothetical protein